MTNDGSIDVTQMANVISAEWTGSGILMGHIALEGADGSSTIFRFEAKATPLWIEWINLSQSPAKLMDSSGNYIPWANSKSACNNPETTLQAIVDPGKYAIWEVDGQAATLTGVEVTPYEVKMRTFHFVFGIGAKLTDEDRLAIQNLPKPWQNLIYKFVTFGR